MSGGPTPPSAADSKFASFSPPPLQELATGPVSQTGPQRQPGVGVGARVCGPKASFNRLAIGTSGRIEPRQSPPTPRSAPWKGGGDFSVTNFRFATQRIARFIIAVGSDRRHVPPSPQRHPGLEPGSRFFLLGPRGGDRLRSGSVRDHPETRTKVSGTPARARGDEKGIANAKYGAVPLEAIRFRLNRIAFSYSLVCRDFRASR